MRPLAIKSAVTAAAAVLLLAPSASASAMSANDTSEEVTISVKGRGLHVDTIHVTSSRQRNFEAFRVYRHTGSAATQSNVTRWKKARSHNAGMTHFAAASWKVNRNFPHGTWLCAIARQSSGNPCIRVHR
jgi:uridine phosphorylase